MAITINTLNSGTTKIFLTHTDTRVTYSDGSTASFNISGAFSESGITNWADVVRIEIGTTVTSIASGKLQAASGLTYVLIPNSVTSIGADLKPGFSGTAIFVGTTAEFNTARDTHMPDLGIVQCLDGNVQT